MHRDSRAESNCGPRIAPLDTLLSWSSTSPEQGVPRFSCSSRADQLEIEVGKVYALDLFHAERAPSESNFRVDTTLQFTSCAIIVDDVVK